MPKMNLLLNVLIAICFIKNKIKKMEKNKMDKKLVKKNIVKREKGYLYYIDKEGNLWKVKARVGGKKGRVKINGYYTDWKNRKQKKLIKIKMGNFEEQAREKLEEEIGYCADCQS